MGRKLDEIEIVLTALRFPKAFVLKNMTRINKNIVVYTFLQADKTIMTTLIYTNNSWSIMGRIPFMNANIISREKAIKVLYNSILTTNAHLHINYLLNQGRV